MKEYWELFAKMRYAIHSQPMGADRLKYQKTEVFTLGLIQ